MKFYVSLTTIPTRIITLYKTLDSIINQTLKPTKIYLNIPIKYIRFNYVILDIYPNITLEMIELQKLENKYSDILKINYIDEDYGPGTKLIGFLLNNYDYDSYIILIDDDVIYKKDVFELLFKNVQPNNAYTYHTHNWNGFIFAQGCDIIALPIIHLNDIYKFFKIIKSYTYILYHDDIWISYYLFKKNIKINKINYYEESIYDPHTNMDALSKLKGSLDRETITNKSIDLLQKLDKENQFNFIESI